MASINLGRVVAGGLVAGVVANAIDFVTNTYVLGADIAAWAPTRNIDPAAMNSGPVAATWIVVDFIMPGAASLRTAKWRTRRPAR